MTQVLGVRIGALPGTTDPTDDDRAVECRDLIATLTADLAGLKAANPDLAARIGSIVEIATALAAKGEVTRAYAALDKATDAVARARASARAASANAAIPPGLVARRKAELDAAAKAWNGAFAGARDQAKPVLQAFAAHSPPHQAGLQRFLESWWRDLDPLLAAARARAGDAGLAGHARAILAAAASLRTEIAADAVFAELDAAGIPARATFLAALQAIERTVASIAPSPGDDGEPS